MKADTWMPLYVGDYLADTGHLTAAEHGAYLLLLMHSWRTGGLPADPARLAAIARMTATEWRRSADTITAFFTSEDGTLVSARLEAERERAINNKEQRSAAGRASARARARKQTDNENPTSVERALNERSNKTPDLHRHLHQEVISLPSEAPSPEPGKPPHDGPPKPDRRAVEAEIRQRFAAFYAAYPRKDGKIAAEKAYRRALQRASADEIDAGLAGYRFHADPQYHPLPATWLNQGRWESDGHAPPSAHAAPAGRLDWVRDELFGASHHQPDNVIDGEIA